MKIHQARKILLDILLPAYGKRESENIARIYFEDRFSVDAGADIDLTRMQEKLFYSDMKRFKEGEPVQYITGKAFFYKYFFKVNKHVLIPRQETELLVFHALQDCNGKPQKILDIGSGSGCVAISLAKQCPAFHVTGIDISEDAIDVAKENKKMLAAENVEFLVHDFLDAASWEKLTVYDMIVSNPPYVSRDEKDLMSYSALKYEPAIALFPPGEDYMIFYKKILDFAAAHLKAKGKLIMEINEFAFRDLLNIIKKYPYDCTIVDDINTKPRILICLKT